MIFYYDEEVINDIDKAIPFYSKKEFESPYRSTVPLLSWLKFEQPMVSSLLRDLDIPADCHLHLEYKVKPPRGSGRASHTDLMVKSGKSALAVEAKWTEPRYKTVGQWLEAGSNPINRRDVFAGWLSLLQKHSQRPLNVGDFSDIVYQMVHRAASACEAGSNPQLAYLVFRPSPDPRTADMLTIHDLTHLWSLLGNPKGFPFYLVDVRLSPTAAFDAIASLPKANQATAGRVSIALLKNNRLLNFDKYCVTKIGDKL